MTSDPFPRDQFTGTLRRLPAYLRLALAVATDPTLAKKRRAAVIAAAGYLVSPVDLVPGVIPVIGQLDDLALALAALRLALAGLEPERRRRHLSAVGLVEADLVEDLAMIGAVSAWTVRAGVRTTRRAAVRGGAMAASGARAAGSAASAGAARLGPRVRAVSDPVARRAAAATPEAAKDAAGRIAPLAKGVTDRLAPSAQHAGSRLGAAARAAASRGASVAGRAQGRRPTVRVSVPARLALTPPRPAPAEAPLPVEPDGFDRDRAT